MVGSSKCCLKPSRASRARIEYNVSQILDRLRELHVFTVDFWKAIFDGSFQMLTLNALRSEPKLLQSLINRKLSRPLRSPIQVLKSSHRPFQCWLGRALGSR